MPDDAPSYLPMIREIFEPFGVARDIPRHQGVVWSSTTPDSDEMAWRARAAESRKAAVERAVEAWKASPKGRLSAAIAELEALSYAEEAYTLRGLFEREVSEASTIPPRAAGAMLAVLAKLPINLARPALESIAELLLQDGRRAA